MRRGVMDELSSEAIRSLLTSLFPSQMVEDLAREREVVVRDRKIDVRMLVWTLVVDFAVGAEARSIAVPMKPQPTTRSLPPVSTTDSPKSWLHSSATSSTMPSRRSLSLTLLRLSNSATSSLLTRQSCGCVGSSQSSKLLMRTSQG